MYMNREYSIYRIEFMNFRLSPPNARTTECDEDYFTVVGSAIETPKLCGDSYSDQHSKSTLVNYFQFE